ncbi:hypothetical protein OHB35_17020 [Streptomyces phaeochromogenes]|uniref:Uncharacterized protein n=1 Tax=Streptomyces phaeochromogenes TaxID=1923 RepID=A0ABZ1HCA0_STRPH|nr:hypothetical protein [Streptomyces phaeochromogenes]WSD14809.1 hypothetical protein OHB35_17020 [Streptomyces phaeochromogenes]
MTIKPANTLKEPQNATQRSSRAAVGGRQDVAEGVRTAVRPDPHPSDGRYPVAWLHINAPYGATPTATSKCLCGRDRRAVGKARVLALITDHESHRDICPLRNPQEGRDAA